MTVTPLLQLFPKSSSPQVLVLFAAFVFSSPCAVLAESPFSPDSPTRLYLVIANDPGFFLGREGIALLSAGLDYPILD